MCESVCILITFTVFYCTFLLILFVCLYVFVCLCMGHVVWFKWNDDEDLSCCWYCYTEQTFLHIKVSVLLNRLRIPCGRLSWLMSAFEFRAHVKIASCTYFLVTTHRPVLFVDFHSLYKAYPFGMHPFILDTREKFFTVSSVREVWKRWQSCYYCFYQRNTFLSSTVMFVRPSSVLF